ncbi:MAG: DUF4157 domain-containing protein [Saprospiraceae bacterium]|nr:DUF4157 domain-containing protein [Lewinellaceae bacterium]
MFFTKQHPEKSNASGLQRQADEQPFFQPKLKMPDHNNEKEEEADQVADGVVQMQAEEEQGEMPVQNNTLQAPVDALEAPETEAPDEEATGQTIQTKPKNGAGGQAGQGRLSSRLSEAKGGGVALPAQTRDSMEQAMGADFSQVRVHNDSNAASMSEALQARAFTHGSDIYFNKGQYAPETGKGKHLLAHELTHVVQQNGPDTIHRSFFGKIWKGIKKGAKAVGRGVSWLGKKIGGGAKWLGGKIWGGMKWLGQKVWSGIKWLGAKAWDIMKWLGAYLYRVGQSALGYIVAVIKEFPVRFWRLIKHLGSALIRFPVWIWDGIVKLFRGDWKGLGDWFVSGLLSGLAWLGRLVGKVFDIVGLPEYLDFIFTLIKFNTRKLNGIEEGEARKVFGNSIDLWRVRLDEKSLIAWIGNKLGGHGGGHMAVTTFHTINFTRKISCAPCNSDMAWLIHELVHVSQMEHVGSQYMGEALHAQQTTGYNYGGAAMLVGKNLKDFNREQQGDIIRDYYNFVVCAPGTHPHEAEYNRMGTQLRNGEL